MLLESITWDSQTIFWLLQEINKRRNMEISNHKPYSRCRVWRCDVTTSNSIQDGGVLVVNILVFDLLVQLQHCTYQRKTSLFSLIKVNTFICKREISGFSFLLTYLYKYERKMFAKAREEFYPCLVYTCWQLQILILWRFDFMPGSY